MKLARIIAAALLSGSFLGFTVPGKEHVSNAVASALPSAEIGPQLSALLLQGTCKLTQTPVPPVGGDLLLIGGPLSGTWVNYNYILTNGNCYNPECTGLCKWTLTISRGPNGTIFQLIDGVYHSLGAGNHDVFLNCDDVDHTFQGGIFDAQGGLAVTPTYKIRCAKCKI